MTGIREETKDVGSEEAVGRRETAVQVEIGQQLNERRFHQSAGMDISGREENACSFPVHLMASVPLMAEEGVVAMSPGYSVLMLRQTLSKTGACFTKILLITGGTRNSIGAHLRGRGRAGVNQVPTESIHLAKGESAVERLQGPTEGVDLLSVRQAEDRQVRRLIGRGVMVEGTSRPG